MIPIDIRTRPWLDARAALIFLAQFARCCRRRAAHQRVEVTEAHRHETESLVVLKGLHQGLGPRLRAEIDAQNPAQPVPLVRQTHEQLVIRMFIQSRIYDRHSTLLEPLRERHRSSPVLGHAQSEMRQPQADLERDTRVHRRPKQHQ